jgi:hypothetical protein
MEEEKIDFKYYVVNIALAQVKALHFLISLSARLQDG